MSIFKVKSTLPVKSDSKGVFYDGYLYFSSNNNLFKVKNNKIILISTCTGIIKSFCIFNNINILCTENRIFFNIKNENIGSLKRNAHIIKMTENYFIICIDNIIEIYEIPNEYKFLLFKRKGIFYSHSKKILALEINEDLFITCSEDYSIRIFNINTGENKIIYKTKEKPVYVNFIDNENILIFCKNGYKIYYNIKESKIVKTELLGSLISCSSCKNFDVAVYKENEQKFIEFSKNRESIYKVQIDYNIKEVFLKNYDLVIKSEDFIGVFDIKCEIFSFKLPLPKVVDFNIKDGLIITGCDDNFIRIYTNTNFICELTDQKFKGKIVGIQKGKNSIFIFSSLGYISAFNYKDRNNYRSFNINKEIKHCAISNDECFSFLADLNNIYIIDMQKSQILDTISTKNILNIIYYKDFLYVLKFNNAVEKWDVFDGKMNFLELGEPVVNFNIKNNILMISTLKKILIYDIYFNFIDSFIVSLEGRNKSEIYNKKKSVEALDFDSNFIFCSGLANQLKIFNFPQSNHFFLNNEFLQKLKISQNKDFENYKEILGRENNKNFNKEKIIECKKIISNNSYIYLLSREGIIIYEKNTLDIDPIEFNVDITPEFIEKNIDNNCYTKALLAALKLNDKNYIDKIFRNNFNIKNIIQDIPKSYIRKILKYSIDKLKYNKYELKYFEVIKWCVYIHKVEINDYLDQVFIETKKLCQINSKNKFIINELLKRRNE